MDMKMVMTLRLMRNAATPMREEHGSEDEVVGDGDHGSVLLSASDDGAEDGDEDEDGGDFEGQQQVLVKKARD